MYRVTINKTSSATPIAKGRISKIRQTVSPRILTPGLAQISLFLLDWCLGAYYSYDRISKV